MKGLRGFFAAHPRFTTGLHVTLAVLPATLMAFILLGFVLSVVMKSLLGFSIIFLAGFIGFFCTGAIWLLSLLLYRFTHAVRESWPDRLRMMLIRFNILGGFVVVLQLWIAVIWLVR